MSRSSTSDRGQTEPLAALVAVAILAIAIGIYASYVGVAMPGESDRNVAEPTVDSVWREIQSNGIYDDDDALSGSIDPAALPEGRYVYLNVTVVGEDGRVRTLDRAVFGPSGTPRSDVLDEVESNGYPDAANHTSRPIPVRIDPGVVRAGKLHVVVWEN